MLSVKHDRKSEKDDVTSLRGGRERFIYFLILICSYYRIQDIAVTKTALSVSVGLFFYAQCGWNRNVP